MITFNNIVSKFEEFCTNHFFIKTFSYGSPSDVDLEKFEDYPLLHLVYTGGDYNSPKAKTYNLEVYILSLPPSKADKVEYQKESISDAEQVAEDILADIQNGGNIFQFGYHYDLINASVTPLEEEKSNALAGCLLDIAISVPYTYDSCNAPLRGVDPDGTPPTAYKARGLLRVKELDGSPDVLSVATINVPNGSLTDDGDGEITLAFGTGPGGPVNTVVETVVNGTAGTLNKGTPVHITGEDAEGRPTVIVARADTPSAMPCNFVLNEQIAAGEAGEAILLGMIENVNTSSFNAGDVLYVSPTGGYTTTKPTGTNLIQNIAVISHVGATNGNGYVYGSGRSNDVPNLPDGKFFIGSATNTQTSSYGLPTTDPTNGETLVYNSTTDAFEGGYPTATGQVSRWVANSTHTVNFTGTGSNPLSFGSILASTLTFDQDCRAGWNMGMNQAATQVLGQPVGIASTVEVTVTILVTAPTGTLGTFSLTNTLGWLSAPTYASATIIGNGTETEYQITSTAGSVNFWQLSNSATMTLNLIANPGTVVVKPQSFQIDITHA